MNERFFEKLDKLEVPAGWTVTSVLGSTPVWLDTLTGFLELVAVCFAILVGYSTWKLNQEKRKKLEKENKK